MCDRILWPMTSTFNLDLHVVKLNRHRSFHSKVFVRTQIHTQQTDCATWTTKEIGDNLHRDNYVIYWPRTTMVDRD